MLTLAALLVSVGLLAVAAATWRTAHKKLLLDLFEKRYALFEETLNASSPIAAAGNADGEAVLRFNRIMVKSQFLFGPEVNEYIESLRRSTIHLAVFKPNEMEHGDERQKAVEAHYKHMINLTKVYDRLAGLMRPYMLMDVRIDDDPFLRIAAPFGWLWKRQKSKETGKPPV